MKKIPTIIALLLIINVFTQAQKVLLEKDLLLKNPYQKTTGPNLKSYTNLFIDWAFIAGKPSKNSAGLDNLRSHTFEIGIRHKRKINETFSAGFDFSFFKTAWYFKQFTGKTFPDSVLHSKQKLTSYNFRLDGFGRVNFAKRGNMVGTYIDLGLYADWAFCNQMITKDHLNDPVNGAKEMVATYSELQYIKNMNYGIKGRLGTGHWAITGSYRLSNMFKNNYHLPEMPVCSVGLELGIY
jgi:hypothetical protein